MNESNLNIEYNEQVAEVTVLKMSHNSMINYNYLIVDPLSRKAVIVDPAWEMGKVDQALIDANATLSGILLTHAHGDHIHLAKPLAAKYQCPIWMSHQEIAASGFNDSYLVSIDETPIIVGQMTIKPILTPGHTAGCMCYMVDDNIFTGDVLFAEGCGMCPDVKSSHEMFDSLSQLKSMLKPYTQIYPGHSYGYAPGQIFSDVLKINIYLQFLDKDSFTAFRLRLRQNRASMFKFS